MNDYNCSRSSKSSSSPSRCRHDIRLRRKLAETNDIVLSDSDYFEWFKKKREKSLVLCSLCDAATYTTPNENGNSSFQTEGRQLELAYYPSCQLDEHSMCFKCYTAIANAEIVKRAKKQLVTKGSRFKLSCPFPYGLPCSGHMDIVVRVNCGLRSTVEIDATCCHCHAEHSYTHEAMNDANSAFFHDCHFCKNRFCIRCQMDPCMCSDIKYREAWSRYQRDQDKDQDKDQYKPIRLSRLIGIGHSREQKSVAENNDYGLGHHVGCPSCGIRLYKESACNEMQHCPHSSVCYACGASAHPWEKALPSYHWNTCPRWDYQDIEAIRAGFVCVEGQCYGAGIGECVDPSHSSGIEAYNNIRLTRFLQRHGDSINI